MNINRETVEYVAELAHLELTEDERSRMQRDLNSILGHIDSLNELDTRNVEPMAQVSTEAGPATQLRADTLRPSLPHDKAMQNAPATDGAFFKVPRVIER